MADIKWFKVTTDMFENEKLRLIDGMIERDTIQIVWMRLLSLGAKTNANGRLFLTEDMPYTEEMLSTLFNRPIDLIRSALNTLCKFSMIDIDEDNIISIINWDKHQNVEGMDRIREQTKKRVLNHRNKLKSDNPIAQEGENNSVEECNVTEKGSNVTVTQQNKKENKNKNKKEEIDKEIETERDKDKDLEKDIEREEIECLEGEENAEEIQGVSLNVLRHYEKITGILGVFSLGALNIAIAQHGEKYLRRAIDKSLEVSKTNMTYVNGILKNWRKDGYPKEVEFKNGKSMLSNGDQFKGFKPKKPRELTAKERGSSACYLI